MLVMGQAIMSNGGTQQHQLEQHQLIQAGQHQQQQLCREPPINIRLEIIKEFIETEKAHARRLKLLDELFYRPLKENDLMSDEQLRSIFSCHQTLYKLHRQIYHTLVTAYSICDEPMIGAALLEIFEGELKWRLERAAGLFCVAQATNSRLLDKMSRPDSKVGKFIAQLGATHQQTLGRLGIRDLLATCPQRLTKYPLLLENLLKATPQWPPEVDEDKLDEMELNLRRIMAIKLAKEREFIKRALYQSRQILASINEAVRVATLQEEH